jgi:hypothetical protein
VAQILIGNDQGSQVNEYNADFDGDKHHLVLNSEMLEKLSNILLQENIVSLTLI